MAQSLRKGSLASEIISALGEGLEDVLIGALQPSKALKHGSSRVRKEYFPKKDHKSLRRAMKRLRDRDLIEKESYNLTDNGWSQFIRSKMLDADLLDDGRMLMIVSDIPESKRSDRDRLRKLLRKAGCILLQRSIFVTPFDLTRDLRKLLVATGLEECVRLYYAEQVPFDSDRN